MNTIKEVENQFTEWEKMFAHPVRDKGFVPRTHKDYNP